MQVDILKHFKLSSLLLQLLQSLRLIRLVLDQFVLLTRLALHIVPQPLNYLFLRGDFVLRPL